MADDAWIAALDCCIDQVLHDKRLTGAERDRAIADAVRRLRV